MKDVASTTNTRLRRVLLAIAILLAAGLVVLSLLRSGAVDATDLAGVVDSQCLASSTSANSTASAPEAVAPGFARSTVANESKDPVVEGTQRSRVMVLVVDDQSRPIRGARVALRLPSSPKRFTLVEGGSDREGRAELTFAASFASHRDEMFVEAWLPGAGVERPLRGHDPGDELRLVVPDIGWLEFRIDGEYRGAGVQVVAVDGTESFGTTISLDLDEANGRLAVGLGLRFQVQGWLAGDRQVHRAVVGPQRAHDVVPVVFDFRRARVAFRLPDGDVGKELAALQLTKRKCTRCDVVRGDDGSFTVLVPLASEAWFVLARTAESFETGPRTFADAIDLGLVRLEPMTTAGFVEARHTDGALAYTQQVPSAFLFPTGERLLASMSTSALFVAGPDVLGTRIATLRLFDGLVVRPSDYEHYAEPAEVLLRGAAIARATLHRGAVLNLVATAEGKLATGWLEHATTKVRVRSSRAWFEEGHVPAWRFDRLPPGDYDVHLEGAEVAPSRVTVTSGSTQRVAIEVTHR